MVSHSSSLDSTPLPIHNSNHSPKEHVSREEHRDFLKEKYDEADLKLCKLEEELDFVIHCASVIRERRSELVQKNLKFSDSEPHERMLEGGDGIIDDYLQLLEKNKKLDDEKANLRKECSAARTDCSNLFAKYHYYANRRTQFSTFRNKQLMEMDTFWGGGKGSAYAERLVKLDNDSAMDRKEKRKRIVMGRQLRRNLATAVGALGASIAFTTLFSATRGRLDIISWAFTSFIFAVFVSALPQGVQTQRKSYQARAQYKGSQQMFLELFMDVALLVLPLLSGIVLLVLAVALLDTSISAPVPGSATAIRVAGYITLGGMVFLAMGVILPRCVAIVRRNRAPPVHLPTERDPEGNEPGMKMNMPYPSHLLPPNSFFRWEFLPGGKDFFIYRQWRHSQVMNQ